MVGKSKILSEDSVQHLKRSIILKTKAAALKKLFKNIFDSKINF
jgi:hypothetical protein